MGETTIRMAAWSEKKGVPLKGSYTGSIRVAARDLSGYYNIGALIITYTIFVFLGVLTIFCNF